MIALCAVACMQSHISLHAGFSNSGIITSYKAGSLNSFVDWQLAWI